MKYFVNNSTHWCSLTLKYVLQHVSVHEFSRNQKIVTDGFPWSLGTEPKKLLSMGFEILGLVSCTTQLVDYSPEQQCPLVKAEIAYVMTEPLN